MEKFKAGQLIPKRIGILDVAKSRHRHLYVFGCDVEVEGKTIKCTSPGYVIFAKKSYIGGVKGKPKEYAFAVLKNVYAIGYHA